ncbi:hypothetical protein PoB_005828800 [Plakobranchus ocellatus]|uniref:Uncharacterized protein n=1 Tax=Plakobranchus ocellatus TaxID=259542 RepID=A0AAV4CKZ1_9GAST|nr:hypothetical protein PoB_005828800 [Plakobranchus ocellatus]
MRKGAVKAAFPAQFSGYRLPEETNLFVSDSKVKVVAMERVKSQQIRSKRGLARQLSELSDRQRQNEIQRDREMRDITLDLQRFQKKSTRDLNEILQEERIASSAIQRRLSLPAIQAGLLQTQDTLRLSPSGKEDFPRFPRSRRSLSIAANHPESPTPSPVPPQPTPKLRRLSVDGSTWGLSPREALEAGGYKLTRSYTFVNGRHYDGSLFNEASQSPKAVSSVTDNNTFNSKQQTALSHTSAKRSIGPLKAPNSPRELNFSPQPTFFKNKDDRAVKLISPTSAALVDNKKSVAFVKPILLDKIAPRKTDATPQTETSESFGTLERGQCTLKTRQDSLPEEKETLVECENSPTTLTKYTVKEKQEPASLKASATTIDTRNTKELAPTETSPEASTPTDTPARIPISPDVTMPGNRRELLQNFHQMEDTVDHPHKTTVFIHEDNTVLRVLEDGTVKAEEEIVEDDEHSMFVSGHRSRRLSEPALGGHFLRELQDKALADVALSASIRSKLPSDLVTEEDEEEDEEDAKGEADDKKQPVDISELKINDEMPSHTKTSEEEKDDADVAKPPQEKMASVKVNSKTSKSKAESTAAPAKDKESFNALKQRRKSEGDVLKFAKVFRVKNTQRVNSGTTKKESDSSGSAAGTEPVTEKDKVWEAVRRCRYIRGYEPPEMEVAANLDISEFVFGHRDPRSMANGH